jgi:N-acetylmuramoyl-L-alanine amidase
VVLTADNPFAVIDNGTALLPAPVRSLQGELQVPVALLESLPRDTGIARLHFDPARRLVFQVPPSGVVQPAAVAIEPGRTRLVFPLDRAEVVVASRSRAHFRIRFDGIFVGSMPETLPAGSLVRAVRRIPAAAGSALELQIAPEAQGFRVVPDPKGSRLALEFAAEPDRDLEPFAPEPPAGPVPIRVVVLDPGHGGADAGVTAAGLVEKNLTLALARRVKSVVEQRLGVRVVLTRDDDRALGPDERAERANRARADLVVSLHFDGFHASRAAGATVYCPPATYAAAGGPGGPGAAEALGVLPWRDVALRHAVRSRDLSDEMLSSLELRGQGPIRLRETLPYTLLGVNAPGILLECATLTSPSDRARLERSGGLDELAVAIADAIAAYQRHE